MKRLYKNTKKVKTKVLSFVLIFCSTTCLQAKEQFVAVVSDVKGRAFYSYGGQTKSLKEGVHIPAGSELYTEEGAQLSFSDYYDHRYYLSGSGHLSLSTYKIELKSGYFWIQSLNTSEREFELVTANAKASHYGSEAILSFDPYSGKTQILVLNGNFNFSNVLFQESYIRIPEGRFSFISNDENDGIPRSPTPIGYSSYQKVTGLFNEISPAKTINVMNRNIASVEQNETQPVVKKKAEVTVKVETEQSDFEKALGKASKRMPVANNKTAKQEILLNNYFKILTSTPKKKVSAAKTSFGKRPASLGNRGNKKKTYKNYRRNNVKVNIYGSPKSSYQNGAPKYQRFGAEGKVTKAQKPKSNRAPASLGGMLPKVMKQKSDFDTFEAKLNREYGKQKRHRPEMNTLIDKLQSVDMDYKKDY